jgi:alkylation response protein AidB-like acyl-CoA dehydrogenase
MDFQLTEEQKMVRNMARDFTQNEIEPHVDEWEEAGAIPRDVLDKMAALGILGGPFPEKYGGSGMDYVSFHLLIEEIAKGCSSLRTSLSVHVCLAGTTINYFGDEEQKARWLPPLTSGRRLGAWALTEPQAGSDAANQQTVATPDGDEYVLNGHKMFISNGALADDVVVFARLPGTERREGICAFLVPKGTPGFEPGTVETRSKLGLRASPTAELLFNDCRIPKENLIGEEGQGWEIAMFVLTHGRLSVAAGAVGVAQACVNASVKFAREREAFGRPIGRFQLVQEMIARMAMETEAGRLLTLKAAHLRDLGRESTLAVSMAKLFTAQMVMRVADDAVQVHGGYGYMGDFPVERYFRDAKICGLYEGTNQIQSLIIANEVLGPLK